jgi:hypothetical protein
MLLRMEGIGSRTIWNNMKERLHTLQYRIWKVERWCNFFGCILFYQDHQFFSKITF